MIEAARTALDFASGRTLSEFRDDLQFQFAVTRALQILLEAASRVHPETRARAPTIEWAQMNGMRNRLVHAYFSTDLDILWRTVTDRLPDLLSALEDLRRAT